MNDLLLTIMNNPPVSWAALAVILLIIEIVTPGGFFIPFAASGFLLAIAGVIGVLPQSFLLQLVIFTAIGVALIPVARKLLRRYIDKTPDINQY